MDPWLVLIIVVVAILIAYFVGRFMGSTSERSQQVKKTIYELESKLNVYENKYLVSDVPEGFHDPNHFQQLVSSDGGHHWYIARVTHNGYVIERAAPVNWLMRHTEMEALIEHAKEIENGLTAPEVILTKGEVVPKG